MLKRIAHIILSVWLAILLLFGGTAKEFVHLFADHHDTIHTHNSNGGLVIEPEHHHCSFLSFSLTAFVNATEIPVVFYQPVVHKARPVTFSESFIQRCIVAVSLRGPPVA